MDLNYHKGRLDGSETLNLDSILVENKNDVFVDLERLGKRWTTLQEQVRPNIPDKGMVNFSFNIKHDTTNHYTTYNFIKPLDDPNLGGETMVESQDKTWGLIKNCDALFNEQIKDRLLTVLEALVSERSQRLGVDKLNAAFSLYSEGKLETDDVLRIGGIDLYQFREYLNTHNIPYRYEEDYIECLDDFKDLL